MEKNALKWGEIANFEASGTVRERRLRIRDEEVVGSNPATPTKGRLFLCGEGGSCFRSQDRHCCGMAFTVYILQSETTERLYIGHTNSLARRLNEHACGQTRATRLS